MRPQRSILPSLYTNLYIFKRSSPHTQKSRGGAVVSTPDPVNSLFYLSPNTLSHGSGGHWFDLTVLAISFLHRCCTEQDSTCIFSLCRIRIIIFSPSAKEKMLTLTRQNQPPYDFPAQTPPGPSRKPPFVRWPQNAHPCHEHGKRSVCPS